MWLRICSAQIVGLLHDSQLCRLRDIVDAASLFVSSPRFPLFDIQDCGLKLPACQRQFVRSAGCLPDLRGHCEDSTSQIIYSGARNGCFAIECMILSHDICTDLGRMHDFLWIVYMVLLFIFRC
ncbi:hypothetical protein BS47DRAFT_333304 [Hydnum rufescens UP504]|uniref:Uncharacterized protein n=1 Tax=Hydnum rufescens UP504 TaxID=1448309 RepID=A0A9P6B6Q5_9AGAM|nr:hypothetical protein BS47DRAFT_333304 [Hydnum rufescens UP504]